MLQSVSEIKTALRSLMNGELAAILRKRGLDYRLIFGATWPQLLALSHEIEPQKELARRLWADREVRECRLLAGLVMPAADFSAQEADAWVGDIRFYEEAFYLTASLLGKIKQRSTKAFEWIAGSGEMRRLCGWLLLARIFNDGMRLQERSENEFIDQADAVLRGEGGEINKACRNAVLKYSLIGQREQLRVGKLLELIGHC